MPPSRTKRVPAAQHSELTEYASLLRTLRTNHTLDLAAHLSQHPPSSSQFGSNHGYDYSSDSDLSDAHHVQYPTASPGATSLPRTSDKHAPRLGTSSARSGESSRRVSSVEAEAAGGPSQLKLKNRDVSRPEWDLADEVQLIAAHVRRQHHAARRGTPIPSNIDPTLADSFPPPTAEDDNPESYSDFSTDEESGPSSTHALAHASAKRALAASSAAHLRALLALCSAHVPRVEPSLRGRLAPLNWASVLSIAGAGGIASDDVIVRVHSRMDAIYGGGPSVSGNPNGLAGLPHTDASRAHPPRLPRNLPSRIPGPFQSTSSAARNRLRVLIAQREEEGDGDLFAFCGPQPRADIDGPGNSKPRRKRKRKEDVTEVNVE